MLLSIARLAFPGPGLQGHGRPWSEAMSPVADPGPCRVADLLHLLHHRWDWQHVDHPSKIRNHYANYKLYNCKNNAACKINVICVKYVMIAFRFITL